MSSNCALFSITFSSRISIRKGVLDFAALPRIRSRPGFGLMAPHSIHRVLTACGIRDASATIEGSRNPIQVVKGVVQLLHGGVSATESSLPSSPKIPLLPGPALHG